MQSWDSCLLWLISSIGHFGGSVGVPVADTETPLAMSSTEFHGNFLIHHFNSDALYGTVHFGARIQYSFTFENCIRFRLLVGLMVLVWFYGVSCHVRVRNKWRFTYTIPLFNHSWCRQNKPIWFLARSSICFTKCINSVFSFCAR